MIHTPASRRAVGRRLDKFNADVAAVFTAMAKGNKLLVEFIRGQAQWRLNTGSTYVNALPGAFCPTLSLLLSSRRCSRVCLPRSTSISRTTRSIGASTGAARRCSG
jgi:hypothetical protein